MARLLLGETSVMEYIALLFVNACMYTSMCLCKKKETHVHIKICLCVHSVCILILHLWVEYRWNNMYLSGLVCSVKLEIEDIYTDINWILSYHLELVRIFLNIISLMHAWNFKSTVSNILLLAKSFGKYNYPPKQISFFIFNSFFISVNCRKIIPTKPEFLNRQFTISSRKQRDNMLQYFLIFFHAFKNNLCSVLVADL